MIQCDFDVIMSLAREGANRSHQKHWGPHSFAAGLWEQKNLCFSSGSPPCMWPTVEVKYFKPPESNCHGKLNVSVTGLYFCRFQICNKTLYSPCLLGLSSSTIAWGRLFQKSLTHAMKVYFISFQYIIQIGNFVESGLLFWTLSSLL